MDVRDSLGALPQLAPMDLLALGAHASANAPASGAQPTRAPGNAAPAPMSQHDIDRVAEGFDAMFASLLIKQMRQSMDTGSMFGHDAGDVLGGLFDTFMGDHFAKAGGLGIGKMVKHQLEERAARQQNPYAAQAAITRTAREQETHDHPSAADGLPAIRAPRVVAAPGSARGRNARPAS